MTVPRPRTSAARRRGVTERQKECGAPSTVARRREQDHVRRREQNVWRKEQVARRQGQDHVRRKGQGHVRRQGQDHVRRQGQGRFPRHQELDHVQRSQDDKNPVQKQLLGMEARRTASTTCDARRTC